MKSKRIMAGALVLVLALLPVQWLSAGVNLKNGNFYISYTDLQMGPQYVLDDIVRTYNSKSAYSGIFGYGWGSDIETRISIYPDGSITLKEHGGGASRRFTTSFYDSSLLEEMIDILVEAAVNNDRIKNTPEERVNFRNRITANEELRNNYWNQYRDKGWVDYVDTYAAGTRWETFEAGNLIITRTEAGYRLTSSTQSRIEEFDLEGRLVRIEDNDGNHLEIEYDERGIKRLINHDGTIAEFTLNEAGKVVRIAFDDREAVYDYEGENLVKNTDTANNVYRYSYDDAHNMIAIDYEDGSTFKIEYYSSTLYTKKITDRNGEETEYEYLAFYNEDGTKDDNHYATRVTKAGFSGQPVTNHYEYWIRVSVSGRRYTHRIKTIINGVETVTTYDEICETPVEIVRGRDTTAFRYNNRCLLTEKRNTGRPTITMEYHETLDKMVYVKNGQGEYHFSYNDKGDLVKARESGGDQVELVYNEKGKILKMIATDETLHFEYNELGKPVRIEIEGAGAIVVSYDEYGEITKVESPDGQQMALKVTQAFQKLLNLTKPAGVNLNM